MQRRSGHGGTTAGRRLALRCARRLRPPSPPALQCHRLRTPRDVSVGEVAPVVEFFLEEMEGVDAPSMVRKHPHILGEARPPWVARFSVDCVHNQLC